MKTNISLDILRVLCADAKETFDCNKLHVPVVNENAEKEKLQREQLFSKIKGQLTNLNDFDELDEPATTAESPAP